MPAKKTDKTSSVATRTKAGVKKKSPAKKALSARKSVAKKTTSRATSTKATKTTKTTRAKSATAKKTTTKAVKAQRSPKKSAAKEVSSRKTAGAKEKSATKPAAKSAKAVKKSVSDALETVSLPSAVSPRLEHKVQATYQLIDMLQRPLSATASVVGFCFLFVGLTALVSVYLPRGAEPALLSCVVTECTTASETQSDQTAARLDSNISFEQLNPLPAVLSDMQNISFRISDAEHVSFALEHVETGTVDTLPVKVLSNKNYQIRLNAADLSSGTYQLVAILENDAMMKEINVGDFVVPEQEQTISAEVVIENDTTLATTTASSTPASTKSHTDIVLSVSDSIWAESVAIEVQNTVDASAVSIFARFLPADTLVFLGAAHRVNNAWFLAVSPTALPAGSYEVYGVVEQDGGDVYTNATQIEVKKEVDEQAELLEESPVEGLERPFYVVTSEDVSVATDNAEVRTIVETAIIERLEEINTQLKIFALLQQTDSAQYDQVAVAALARLTDIITNDISNVPAATVSQAELYKHAEHQLTLIKERVIAFEDIRVSRLGSRITADTDNDGLSDFDEEYVLGSDATQADTDLDGQIDSLEILYETDVLRPDAVSIPANNQTFDTAATAASLITISSVLPYESDMLTGIVITGVSLPQTFVSVVVPEGDVVVYAYADEAGVFELVVPSVSDMKSTQLTVSAVPPALYATPAFSATVIYGSQPVSDAQTAAVFSSINSVDQEMAFVFQTMASLVLLVLGLFLLMVSTYLRKDVAVATVSQA